MSASVNPLIVQSDLWNCIEFGSRLDNLEVMAAIIVTLPELSQEFSALAIWQVPPPPPPHTHTHSDIGPILFARLRADLPHSPQILDVVCILAFTLNELIGPDQISLLLTPAHHQQIPFR
jgi:hypothetical protein